MCKLKQVVACCHMLPTLLLQNPRYLLPPSACGVTIIKTTCGYAQSRNPSQGAGGEIANISWNRKLQHILASCTIGGSVTVWDLKKQQPVLNVRDSSG